MRYEYKNGEIREIKNLFPLINAFYSTKLVQEFLSNKKGDKEAQEYILFKPMIVAMMKNLKKNYPNTKMVFLDYPQSDESWCALHEDLKKFIADEGYIYINANDLVGDNLGIREYKIEGEWIHPNEKAWDLLAPKLVKKLNL